MELEWFRAYVESLLREQWDGDVSRDAEGDWAFRHGAAAGWVAVRECPYLRLEVFAYAAHGVKSSAKLLREINEANWGLVDGRVYWRGGFVVVETSFDAQRVDAESLERACLSVGRTADDLSIFLAAVFDGQTPFPVVLRDLSARHPGQERDALAGLDLTLHQGRRIAVVGPSGSGKTTLAQVLLRFLDARAGSYTLAGVDAYALDGDDVRRLVGLCAQDAHLFDSSVRENLLLARRDATEDELRAALARARLLEWADSLPDGLDTLVGEHGARLSGGQRQRLALARALLADFPVLVLDEPAEHLDLPTADALTADLLAATKGRTTLLITHRLAGLQDVDEVLVLDAGRVVQRGTYAKLAAVDGPLREMLAREAAVAQPATVSVG